MCIETAPRERWELRDCLLLLRRVLRRKRTKVYNKERTSNHPTKNSHNPTSSSSSFAGEDVVENRHEKQTPSSMIHGSSLKFLSLLVVIEFF